MTRDPGEASTHHLPQIAGVACVKELDGIDFETDAAEVRCPGKAGAGVATRPASSGAAVRRPNLQLRAQVNVEPRGVSTAFDPNGAHREREFEAATLPHPAGGL